MNAWETLYSASLLLILTGCGASISAINPTTASTTTTTTTLTNLTGIVSIAAGKFDLNFSCAVTSAGAALCWGDNSSGELGDGTTASRSNAAEVSGLTSGITQVSLGNNFGLALSSGEVVGWGANSYYSIGDETLITRYTPSTNVLSGTNTQISAGGSFGCSLQSSQTYCWGNNASGQLGIALNTEGTLPEVGNPPETVTTNTGSTTYAFTQVTTGMSHSCGLLAGAVYCWGENGLYQIGDGTLVQRTSPTAASVLTASVTSLSAGMNHTCAVKSGSVYCWGANNYGQLGIGSVTDLTNSATHPSTPQLVTGAPSNPIGIYSGAYHSCAVYSSGPAYCWGRNDWGQLGTGASAAYSNIPLSMNILSQQITSMALGILHSCAILADTSVQCWGHNGFGELGDGTGVSNLTAVNVKK